MPQREKACYNETKVLREETDMKLTDLSTPALVADGEKIDRNISAMKELLSSSALKLRPHYKSHKCSAIARRQIADGAVGMTCATVREAEDLADSGVEDILLANQIVEEGKICRVALLAKKVRLTVCVDSAGNAEALSRAAVNAGSTVYCLAEYEIGMKRCGVDTKEEYLALVKKVMSLPNLVYQGIQAYAGHASHMTSDEERSGVTAANRERLRELIAYLRENGVTAKTISGGSTGTAELKARDGLYTELQAGSYLWLDSTYNKLNVPFVNALYVLSTVVSRRPGIAILDVGAKSIGADQDLPEVLTMDGTPVRGIFELNEEHLKIYDPSAELIPGQKVLVIPGHCCTTVNLYEKLYLFRNGRVDDRLAITARERG